MSGEFPEIFRHGNILCAPIVHSRYYFALWIQKLFEEFKPEIVAVEFPQPLKPFILKGVRRLPYLSVVCASQDGEEYSYVPIDPCDGLIHGVRLADEKGVPVHFIDLNRVDLSSFEKHYTPDDFALPRIGPENYYSETMKKIELSEKSSIDYMREQHMSARLRQINLYNRRTLFICGMIHWERIRSFLTNGGSMEYFDLEEQDAETFLANLHPDSAPEVLEEIPAIAGRFEETRAKGEMDRNEEAAFLIIAAEEKSNEKLSTATKRSMGKYLRNLSMASMQFSPDLVDLLTAAKNIAGNEFAIDLLDVASKYPYFREEDDLEVIQISRTWDESDEGMLGIKKLRLHRRQNMPWKRNMKRVVLKNRPPERYNGEWRDVWNENSEHVSYPPEDIRLEDYSLFLKNKIMKMLSEEKARTEEFSTSIKDGIDMRETIRNLHTGKIYVRDVPFIKGRVGPVVIIFDEDRPEKFPWRTVWYSEHSEESDLIMYTTAPGDALVGPGISKCKFGGYASIFPPKQIQNYWMVFEALKSEGILRNEADLLLYTAIMYSEEKYIGYVAKKRPSQKLTRLAESMGFHVVYIPITSLSPSSVEKLQRFHILGSRRLRAIAHRYIL